MRKLEDAYAEKILANVAYLAELDSADAALFLRQCSIEIYQEDNSNTDHIWKVNILAPRDIYSYLNDECNPVTISVCSNFKRVANTENAVIEGVLILPNLVEASSTWRNELPKAPTYDEQILASAVHFLREGNGEMEIEAANLLMECILTTAEELDEYYGETFVKTLEIDLSCTRKAYDILSQEKHLITQVVKESIEAVLPKKYYHADKKFYIRAQLIQFRADWRNELDLIFSEFESKSLKLSWADILSSQQKEFIERLHYGTSTLLRCDGEGCHTELIIIPNDRLTELRQFCWKMTDKYRRGSNQETFVNHLKGKLGEEAFSMLLGKVVTAVDYEFKTKGDGKIDFQLTSYPEISIQVKARNGDFRSLQWHISPQEIELNRVIICFLIQEEVSEAQQEYHIIAAGFMPTDILKSTRELNNQKIALSINELYYMGGLKGYLDFLAAKADFDTYVFQTLSLNELEDSFGDLKDLELKTIWENVLRQIRFRGTQVLLQQCGTLFAFDGQEARIGIRSQPLFKMAKEKLTTVETAFETIFGKKIRVSLEVYADNEYSSLAEQLPDPDAVND